MSSLQHLPQHVTPFPTNPQLQVQVMLQGVVLMSVHSALVSQLLAGVEHTSQTAVMKVKIVQSIIMSSLQHGSPFPVYPGLQVQVKLQSGVLVQAALVSQLLAEVEHTLQADVMEIIQWIIMSRLREHETLIPVYPGLQMQLIPAGVLAQAALGPQVILTFIKASLVIDEVRHGEVMVDSQQNSAASEFCSHNGLSTSRYAEKWHYYV